jgi:hypothetical protein
MTVGGVDTYYDYDERQWKFRRLGGGPVRRVPACPSPHRTRDPETDKGPAVGTQVSPESGDGCSTPRRPAPRPMPGASGGCAQPATKSTALVTSVSHSSPTAAETAGTVRIPEPAGRLRRMTALTGLTTGRSPVTLRCGPRTTWGRPTVREDNP